jgi:hypothetical protein
MHIDRESNVRWSRRVQDCVHSFGRRARGVDYLLITNIATILFNSATHDSQSHLGHILRLPIALLVVTNIHLYRVNQFLDKLNKSNNEMQHPIDYTLIADNYFEVLCS